MCAMKKLFTERARLVIYLEQSDVIRMTAKARENGELLAEWARGVLRSELTISGPEPRAENRRPHPRIRRKPNTDVSGDAINALTETAAVLDAACQSDYQVPEVARNIIAKARHTAESNWRSCGCGTCCAKRKEHGL